MFVLCWVVDVGIGVVEGLVVGGKFVVCCFDDGWNVVFVVVGLFVIIWVVSNCGMDFIVVVNFGCVVVFLKMKYCSLLLFLIIVFILYIYFINN